MTAMAAGGFVVGFIERNWGDQIPSIPLLGRKGTIALACYFMAPKNKILQDAGKAAASIAGYELGATGAISGIDNPYAGDINGPWCDDDGDDDWEDDDDGMFQTS
jgi:hypothetical protein